MVSVPPPITMGEVTYIKICQNFVMRNFFLYLWENKPLWVELKTNGGIIFITILLHSRYFICLKTANTKKSGVFLLTISLGNVNASVVTHGCLNIYNFSF